MSEVPLYSALLVVTVTTSYFHDQVSLFCGSGKWGVCISS